jgi:hypothetical protein
MTEPPIRPAEPGDGLAESFERDIAGHDPG